MGREAFLELWKAQIECDPDQVETYSVTRRMKFKRNKHKADIQYWQGQYEPVVWLSTDKGEAKR